MADQPPGTRRLILSITNSLSPTKDAPIKHTEDYVLIRLLSGLIVVRETGGRNLFYIVHPRFGLHRRHFTRMPMLDQVVALLSEWKCARGTLVALEGGSHETVRRVISKQFTSSPSMVPYLILALLVASGFTLPWLHAWY